MIALRTLARTLGRSVLDALLPPTCATCDTTVDHPGQLCTDCFRSIEFITEPCCRACGTPFATLGLGGLDRLCIYCGDTLPAFARARAAFRYEGPGKKLVTQFKYSDRTEIATMLAAHMARAGAALLRECDVLIPVPLHRSRLRQRKYNQSALLARAIGRLARRPVLLDGLVRIRKTAPLLTRTRPERRAILDGAIAARPSRAGLLAGARVLLIDDVLTSGATASACAVALLAAGVATVDVLVAARVFDDRLTA